MKHVVVKIQSLMRGALVRKRSNVGLMFKLHGVPKESLSLLDEISIQCKSPSKIVNRVESKIGLKSLLNAFREIIEDQRELEL